jgi:hypothetical protein
LYLILPTVVRVIRMGFCLSPEMFDPEESAAFCSESPDENALIQGQGLIKILVRTEGIIRISSRRENVGRRTDWAKKTVAIFYVSMNVAPKKICPTVRERLGVQGYCPSRCIRWVVVESSKSP